MLPAFARLTASMISFTAYGRRIVQAACAASNTNIASKRKRALR